MKPILFQSGLRPISIVLALAGATPAFAQITISPTTTPFTDISSTGTSPGTATDDSELNVTSAQLSAAGFMGNELLPLADIRIGNNGGLLWNNTASEVGYVNNLTLPTMAAANAGDTGNGGLTAGTSFLCVYWDDNYPLSGQGANVHRWQVIGGNLIVQWSNEVHYNVQSATPVQYQIVVYGGATIASGAPLVDYVYNDTLLQPSQHQNDGGSATIGYKNWNTVAAANDVEYGLPGGNGTITDPPFGDSTMHPKVAGWASSNDPTLPHALRIKGTSSYIGYCFGDGTGAACPCANNGITGNGCSHSVNGNGGHVGASGLSSISNDTMVLNGTEMPNSSALYFQGTSQLAAGAGIAFGDGKRCVGGSIMRLGTKVNAAGASAYPVAGDVPIHIKGAASAGDVRQYQIWFRNAAAYCTPSTFNLTNGVETTWSP